MTSALILCENCRRHVFAREAVCPFCAASLGSGSRGLSAAAVVLSAGLALTGCSRGNDGPADVYGSPPPRRSAPSASVEPPVTDPPVTEPDGSAPPPVINPTSVTGPISVPVPAYGKPPPRSKTDVPAPAYGGAPPRRSP